MAVLSIHTFKTRDGRLAEHLALAAEANERLRALDVAAMAIQPLVGGEPGTIVHAANYADNREYVAAMQRVQGDEAWHEFYLRAMSTNAAELVETALATDTDPTYTLDPNRPLGAISSSIWQPRPGRLGDFVANVDTAKSHLERLGGAVRVVQSQVGGDPLSVGVIVGFDDLDHYGEFGDKLAIDEGWQNFWTGVMSDPSADLVRNGLFVPIP